MLLRGILLFLLIALAIRAFGRFISGVSDAARGFDGRHSERRTASAPPVKMVKDPVCGTFVVPGKAIGLSAGDQTHWFCSERCRSQFAGRA